MSTQTRPETTEQIARRIADAGMGLAPTSRIRETIYQVAIAEIRALKGEQQPGEH